MNQSNKLSVTIITPVWNGMPFLQECIQSVLRQDFQDWEMLISDDGSKDDSRAYLNTITDPRIKIFYQKQNQGIFGNLNWLFNKASSPISQILCQDDYFINKNSLGDIVEYWHQAPLEVGFVRFNHNDTGKCALTRYQKEILPDIINPGQAAMLFYIFGNIPGNLSNVSLRTHIVKDCNGYDQSLPYAGDFDFWYRAGQKFSIGIQKKSIIYVRRHPGVASNFLNKKGELLEQKEKILSNLFKLISNNRFQTLLKIHGTINFDSLQRDSGLKLTVLGNGVYLRELERVSEKSSFVLSKKWRWLLFMLSFGGRIGRVWIAKKILSQSNIISELR